MKYLILLFTVVLFYTSAQGQQPVPVKPRILVSTDIGGSDPDDNQSMAHLLMYSDLFNIEGLVSSPSYGGGSKEEILRMIGLYEKDYPKLIQHDKNLNTPDYLRSVTKQGHRGISPFAGYSKPTEGSDWIVKCARKKSNQPLWVLIWGGLEDLAQALHDAPDIKSKIKVYWIGGPNKIWGANSYVYIVKNFPDLWFIENNASYRGFFSNTGSSDKFNSKNYFGNFIQNAGALGFDFDKNRYQGNVKMGDTPSLLYMMDGNPNDPARENWGGSFEKMSRSPRYIIRKPTTNKDTAHVYSILEFHFEGPKLNIPADSACFTLTIKAGDRLQKWNGYYMGNGDYAVNYAHKQKEDITYTVTSNIPGFKAQSGALVIDNVWPGKPTANDFKLGSTWYTDKSAPELFDGGWQGAVTVRKWREAMLADWAKRWAWLK
ncbi:uncharacterized protein DUF5060 [Mucilaginibacter yixingensis]|uniref:Uncharacterized protein DUF5060 n=1 Tax=Mucilaginibacter yixingensis TaxID=1295612 RepID=A0A2T5JBK3_9SPHI|nr:nucleoside hydrolase-like domain-containing protein [Mucilaginibacter yixingensis]PTQ98242.1 uncharacterized protein DUF5060 [Mucilaginibacter yixingensis]